MWKVKNLLYHLRRKFTKIVLQLTTLVIKELIISTCGYFPAMELTGTRAFGSHVATALGAKSHQAT